MLQAQIYLAAVIVGFIALQDLKLCEQKVLLHVYLPQQEKLII